MCRNWRTLGVFFFLLLMIAGCGSNGDSIITAAVSPDSSPTIASINPASASAGTTVTITGTNFGVTPADNVVNFNGTAAVVTQCTSTQIIAVVPDGATTGPITVTVGDKSAMSSTDFKIEATTPSFAGSYFDGAKWIPCYWTGTIRTDLSGDGTNNALAFSPAVSSGGAVYTAGYYSDGTKNIPCYWSGSRRIDLPGDGVHDASGTSLAVSGGTVYTAGSYYNGRNHIPCFWTGTTRTDLHVFPYAVPIGNPLEVVVAESAQSNLNWIDVRKDGYPLSIAVSDGTVYTAGYMADPFTWGSPASLHTPCYWKGTAPTILDAGLNDAAALSIAVSGGTVYTAGYYAPTYWLYFKTADYPQGIASPHATPCYWAGNTRVDLPGNGAHDAYAYSIAISGRTVYTAGCYSDGVKYIPCYWVGTTRVDLPGDGTHNAYAASITVIGGTVYVAGNYSDGTKVIPCYWVGATRTDLPGDGVHNAFVNASGGGQL